jgi:hypothetical protein
VKKAATIREALVIVLATALGVLPGCKKASPPQPAQNSAQHPDAPIAQPDAPEPIPQTTPSVFQLTDPNAEPLQSNNPPEEVFDLKANPGATVLTAIDVTKMSSTELQYGIAPKRTKDVEYVDDVIVMEEGDKAIRSMAGNGLSWTFDASAPHVSEFQEGKVVFATGRAVGRIVGLKREGANVTTILAPVQLTDVIKNGHFAMSQPVDVNNMLAYVAPDFPQPKEELTGGKTSEFRPPDDSGKDHFQEAVVVSRVEHGRWKAVSMAQTYADGRRITYRKNGSRWSEGHVSLANVATARLLNASERLRLSRPPEGDPEVPEPPPVQVPNAGGLGKQVPVELDGSDVRTQAVASNSGIGLQFYYTKNGFNIFSECLLKLLNAKVSFELNITNGTIQTAGVKLDGELGLVLLAEAATSQEFRANLHKTVWEPVDFTIPLGLNGVAGVPFSVTFNSKLVLNTGFSARTSKLTARGDYTFGGGIWAGLKNGRWSVSGATGMTAVTDIGQSTAGISVGINSLIVAAGIRVMVGIGAFGFNTGVFADIQFDGSMLRAPDEVFPCRQGTIEAFLYYGIGYSLPKAVVEVINAVLKLFTSYQLERVGTIASSKPVRLFHGVTQIPNGCASPKPGGG